MPLQDDDEAYLHDREMPDDSDMDQDDDSPTLPCPYCGRLVYEEAQLCPHCHSYIVQENTPTSKPWLRWAVVLLISAVVLGYCHLHGLLFL